MLRLTRNGVRGAMCDQGRTWGPQQLIFDPADPPDASLATNQHLGTLRPTGGGRGEQAAAVPSRLQGFEPIVELSIDRDRNESSP